MSRQTNVFEYLDAGVIAGKWVLANKDLWLSVTSTDSREAREFRASYDEADTLVLSFRVGEFVQHQKSTGTVLTSEENTSGARLLLELALYMLSAGVLDPSDITDKLAPI